MRILTAAVLASAVLTPLTALAADTANPISPERLSTDVRVLANSKLAGRAPGGPGEAGTIAYISGQFKAMGLKPAGDKGGWTQAVPLLRFQIAPNPKFSLTAGGKTQQLTATKEIMATTQRPGFAGNDQERAPGLRRLRRHRPRAEMGRLQGRRPEGQDRRHPDQRPGFRGQAG